MNDRFKFRAFDKLRNIMVYCWQDATQEQKKLYEETYGLDETYNCWQSCQLGCLADEYDYPKEEFVVEQCTGLKDKNGKLIYEGDILKNGKHIYPVEWCVNGFAVNDGYDYLIDNEEWKIIGNIHENTDLLEIK